MKTIEIKVYKYSELSKEAQQTARNYFYDTNINYSWWEGVYEDAENVGIKITSFDLDRSRHATGEIKDAEETARKIIEEHGDQCETFKTAQSYIKELREIENEPTTNQYTEEEKEEQMEYLKDEFKKNIIEDYSIMLQKENEYLTSAEAIVESIEANDYDFTEDGTVFHG